MNIEIIDLFRHSTDDGVCVVKWQATKKEGEYEASACGAEVFHPDPALPSFKPYESLTAQDVEGWLENKKGWLDSTKARLDADIERQKNPPVLHGLPWADAGDSAS